MRPHDLTVASFFSGIGLLDLGLEWAGWRTVSFSEIEPYACRVLEARFPGVPNLGDVHAIESVPDATLWAGGFPCQPVSNAGKRLGTDDARWLWPAWLRLIRELRPRYLLLENVAALLGRGLGDVLGDLAACGYDAEWDCIPASAVGAPHRRDRIWIVAYPRRRIGEPDRAAGDLVRSGGGPEGAAPQREWARRPAGDSGAGGAGVPDLAHSDGQGLQGHRGLRVHGSGASERLAWTRGRAIDGWWKSEPGLGRVAHGVPHRVDRLRTLGNAVVPQVAEHLGRRLAEVIA